MIVSQASDGDHKHKRFPIHALFARWLQAVHASGALSSTMQRDTDGAEDTTTPSSTPPADGGVTHPVAAASILVGMPVITSPEGLRFWLRLCGVSNRRDVCKEAFEAFRNPAATARSSRAPTEKDGVLSSGHPERGLGSGRDFADDRTPGSESPALTQEMLPYGQAWFDKIMSKLRALDCSMVAGVHVMALGPGPRRRARALVGNDVFRLRTE